MKDFKLIDTELNSITDNCAWCNCFNLVWNEFQNTFLDENFICTETNETIENYRKLHSNDYVANALDNYTKVGFQTPKTKKEIVKALKKQFKTKSDILNSFDFSNKKSDDLFLYSILMFNAKFDAPFKNTKLDDLKGFEYDEKKESYMACKAIFYLNDDEFAMSISAGKKTIYFYRTDKILNFADAYNFIKSYDSFCRYSIENIFIPDLNISVSDNFENITNKKYAKVSDVVPYKINNGARTFKLELSKDGVKVKSEAAVSFMCMGAPLKQKKFIFNKTFYMLVEENDKLVTALHIKDIKDFNK